MKPLENHEEISAQFAAKIRRLALIALTHAPGIPTALATENGAHPQHGVAGAARHSGKNPLGRSADYSYTLDDRVFVHGCYEQVR